MKKEQKEFIESVSKHWYLRNTFTKDVCLFIACQFALESSFGNSPLAVAHFNFSGMKMPSKRYGTYLRFSAVCANSKLPSSEFAWYSSFDECVIDYVCWVLYFRPLVVHLSSAAHYASWIEKRYCPEEDYVKKIVSLYNQFKNVD